MTQNAPHISLRSVSLSLPVSFRVGIKDQIEGLLFPSKAKGNKGDYRTIIKDVSIEIENGSRIGVIGHNGAGKTSFLRLLSGVYEPTQGDISVSGTLQSFLNTSIDFDFRRTARENIYVRALCEGIDPKETPDIIARVLDFSELEEFADYPTSTFSSGMMARLLFTLSLEFSAQILILDEWLSVGDRDFVEKAETRMKSVVQGSGILVLASHSLELIRGVCDRAIVMDHGTITFSGSVDDAIEKYISG